MPIKLPPEKITQLMQFIAQKAEHVKSPMKITELIRQFKEETGAAESEVCLKNRITRNHHKIHKMNEFDIDTKVKLIFALRAPVDPKFLIEIMKHAKVEVNDQQRIIKYKKNDGGMELRANLMRLSDNEGEQRDKTIIQFLIEKTTTLNSPMVDALFVMEFKDVTGCLDSLSSLNYRYRRVRNTIFELPGINKNTKVKMMFISNAQPSDDILKELRKDAYVEVDVEGRIGKYKANDGSLELEGDHSMSVKMETSRADIKRRWLESISTGRKRTRGVAVEDDDVEESLRVEDDSAMDFDTNNADDFNYDPSNYELDMEHIPIETKPESLLDVKSEKPEESSRSIGGDHFFFDSDPPTYKEDMEHNPVEKKPVDLIEVKAETPEQPSTSNGVYHYEDNLEHILTEPKPESDE